MITPVPSLNAIPPAAVVHSTIPTWKKVAIIACAALYGLCLYIAPCPTLVLTTVGVVLYLFSKDSRKLQPVAQPTIGLAKNPIEFLDGAPDNQGRTFDSILKWDDDQLEDVHDWVQQVFPTYEPSNFRADAADWILTTDMAAQIRNHPARQDKIRRAFQRIWQFYFRPQNLSRWVTPGNHNFRRLTRIILSLKNAGLKKEAQDLFDRLSQVYQQNRQMIGSSYRFWRDALP